MISISEKEKIITDRRPEFRKQLNYTFWHDRDNYEKVVNELYVLVLSPLELAMK